MCVFCYFQVFIVLFPAGVCVRMVEENCGVWGFFYFLFYIYIFILMLNFLIKQCYIYKSKLQKWIQRSGVICRCSHSILLGDEGT
jgi:hypothetical protein